MYKSVSTKSLAKESTGGKLVSCDDDDLGDILDQLKCPVCLEVPQAEIYQCKNGHTLCHTCVQSVKICPQCRVHFERDGGVIRVRALESLLDSVKVACPHKAVGCMEKIPKKDMNLHVKNCLYNGKCIQLCKKLGYNCDFWTNDLNADSAMAHFKTAHNAVVVNEDSVDIEIANFINKTDFPITTDGIWSPIFVNTSDGLHFIILTFLNCFDESMSWACLKINHEDDSAMTSEVELRIENRAHKPLPLKWKMFPVPLLELQNVNAVDLAPQRILTETLNKNYVRYSGVSDSSGGILPFTISVSSSPVLKQEEVCAQKRKMSRRGFLSRPITINEIIPRFKKEQDIFKPIWMKLSQHYNSSVDIIRKSLGLDDNDVK